VPREDDDSNNNFYEELQQVFEHYFSVKYENSVRRLQN